MNNVTSLDLHISEKLYTDLMYGRVLSRLKATTGELKAWHLGYMFGKKLIQLTEIYNGPQRHYENLYHWVLTALDKSRRWDEWLLNYDLAKDKMGSDFLKLFGKRLQVISKRSGNRPWDPIIVDHLNQFSRVFEMSKNYRPNYSAMEG